MAFHFLSPLPSVEYDPSKELVGGTELRTTASCLSLRELVITPSYLQSIPVFRSLVIFAVAVVRRIASLPLTVPLHVAGWSLWRQSLHDPE